VGKGESQTGGALGGLVEPRDETAFVDFGVDGHVFFLHSCWVLRGQLLMRCRYPKSWVGINSESSRHSLSLLEI